jgi:hypothetical protein
VKCAYDLIHQRSGQIFMGQPAAGKNAGAAEFR